MATKKKATDPKDDKDKGKGKKTDGAKKPAKKKKPTREEVRIAREEKHAREAAGAAYGEGSLERLGPAGKVGHITTPVRTGPPVSTEMAGGATSIAQAESAYKTSLERDSFVTSALSHMMQNLEGPSGAEMNAQRESANRGINEDKATMERAAKQRFAEYGVSGTAATNSLSGIGNKAAGLRAQSYTDLLGKWMTENTTRTRDFANASNTADSTMRNARQNALDSLLKTRSDVAGYQQSGEIANANLETSDLSRALATDTANSVIDTGNLDREQGNNIFDIQQGQAEKAGYLGTYYGDIGVSEARKNSADQNRLAHQYYKLAAKGE